MSWMRNTYGLTQGHLDARYLGERTFSTCPRVNGLFRKNELDRSALSILRRAGLVGERM